jgi:transposase-like protein
VPPVDRRNPIRAASSESTCSLLEFAKEFPDDEACLVWLWRERFAPDGEHAHCSRCDAERVFKRYATAQKRPCWFCQTCGHRIHPMAGTIFERSSTSLQLWFYAMYLMASTRCGISAKQLERELGVHYKTAWRMFNKIRNQLMTQEGAEPLAGSVEADETFVGGKPRESYRREVARRGWNMQTAYWDRKAIVFGAVERGGKLRAEVIPDSRARTLDVKVREFIVPESILYTDDFQAYRQIGRKGYVHRRINHSGRVYVMGDVHTQTIEGFFGLFKNGVRGVYHSVSQKWLQGYVNEYVWRYNRRDNPTSMFHALLGEAVSRAD